MARTPRLPPIPAPESKLFVTLVYAGARRLVSGKSGKPRLGHVYYDAPPNWEELGSPNVEYRFGDERVYKKRLGSHSIGVVEVFKVGEGTTVYANGSFKGFWRVADDVVAWQAKHSVTMAEVVAYEQRCAETRNLIREQLAPLAEAMRGLTRNERAVFLSMVMAELTTGVSYF